jgi:hypothetical protein
LKKFEDKITQLNINVKADNDNLKVTVLEVRKIIDVK